MKRRLNKASTWLGEQGLPDGGVKMIVLLVVIPAFVYSLSLSNSVRNDQINGCERGSAVRIGLSDFLQGAEQARQESANEARESDPKQARIDQAAADEYARINQTLISAAAPVALTPGSVDVDCEAAYPKPWPLSMF